MGVGPAVGRRANRAGAKAAVAAPAMVGICSAFGGAGAESAAGAGGVLGAGTVHGGVGGGRPVVAIVGSGGDASLQGGRAQVQEGGGRRGRWQTMLAVVRLHTPHHHPPDTEWLLRALVLVRGEGARPGAQSTQPMHTQAALPVKPGQSTLTQQGTLLPPPPSNNSAVNPGQSTLTQGTLLSPHLV